jgi:hypothetical protein
MHPTIPTIDASMDTKGFNRPIKTLRKPRRIMLETRSLPSGSFGFGNPEVKFIGGGALKGLEEEDWSIPTFQPKGLSHVDPNSDDHPSFEPMVLT